MTPDPSAQIDDLLAGIWQRNLPVLLERLDTLDSAAAAAAAGTLATEPRHQARDVSHKLAGILGTFGHHHATEIARRIEELFADLPPAQPDTITPLTVELRQSLFSALSSPNGL